ncbi:hypothetical protein [Streptomyces sp. TRM64462]|uniref:hypothetical protein n=1 Tax=Streptomyces sp. TRM64462 TaxID=2741726 RepID=UPI0015866267|nr:hypothetical protein [Streptomyces sp. TRM64462]
MNLRSGWLTPSGQTREDTRVTQLGALTPESPVRTRSGILPGSANGQFRIAGFTVSGAAAMTATVFPGRAVVQGMDGQGAYPLALTQPVTLTFADGDAQHDRIDLVCLRVQDDAYDGTGTTAASVEVLAGTPDPSPQAPAVPATALPLYEVRVPAEAAAGTGGIDWTTALTDRRTATVALGGILPVPGGDSDAGAYPGQYRDASGVLERWDGTQWVGYARGLGGIAPSGALGKGQYTGQYRDTPARLERWDGALWRPAVPGPAFQISNDAGYTASTTFVESLLDTPGSPLSVTFTAPPSGAVLVTVGARMLTSGTSDTYGFITAVIRRDGTVVTPAHDDRSAINTSPRSTSCSTTFRVTGLTAGAVHTATLAYRSDATTVNAWFDNRFVRVDPLL